MKKKKQLVLTVIAIVTLVVITVGVSYAFFSYTKKGTTENSIKTGSITFLYTEVTGVGKGIKIEDSLPMTDEQGKLQTGNGNVFEFKVTSDTLSNTSIPYEVTARKSSDSTLDEAAVKLYLTEVDGEENELLLDNYSSLKETDTKVPEGIVEKTLYKGKVPANTTKYEKNFKLRMWIDEDTNYSPVKDEAGNDTYPYNGKKFTVTINVYANANVVTESEKALEANANIKSVLVGDPKLGDARVDEVEGKVYQYETTLPGGTTYTYIYVTPENEYSTVKVEKIDSLAYNETKSNVKRLSTQKRLELNPGDNYFKITIISEDKTETNEYKIKISVVESASIFGKQYSVIQKEPTLTTSSNNTSDESGLYKSTATNTEESTYYFRGAVENNYVSFAGQTWRIVRINEDGTIRMVMANGINSYAFNSNYNNYSYMYYTNSQVKSTLESWYQTNIESNINLASKVATGDYYCEQAKVKYYDSWTSGSTNMTFYKNYTPDFKCTTDGNGKGIVNASVGLLNYDEVVFAGGIPGPANYSYYLFNGIDFWTMSPAGFSDSSISFNWQPSRIGSLDTRNVNSSAFLRPVINLKANTQASSGDGTKENPFVIE